MKEPLCIYAKNLAQVGTELLCAMSRCKLRAIQKNTIMGKETHKQSTGNVIKKNIVHFTCVFVAWHDKSLLLRSKRVFFRVVHRCEILT